MRVHAQHVRRSTEHLVYVRKFTAARRGAAPIPRAHQGPSLPWLSFDQSIGGRGRRGAPAHTWPCVDSLRRAAARVCGRPPHSPPAAPHRCIIGGPQPPNGASNSPGNYDMWVAYKQAWPA
eukprot:365483-Chlamydomonas_euryale.AAC.7